MIKALIATVLGFNLNAAASSPSADIGLPPETVALASVSGSVVGVEPLCPAETTCVTNGTIVNLVFTGGCLDSFSSLTHSVSDSRSEVFVHALLAVNLRSPGVRCARAPQFTRRLQLPNVYPPFTIKFLGDNQSVSVP